MKAKRSIVVLFIFFSVFLIGCSASSADTAEIIWAVAPSRGGYQMETESMSFTNIVDGGYKWTRFVSMKDQEMMEVYIAPTETIVLSTQNGVTRFFRETSAATDQSFTNPLVSILEAFQKLPFSKKGTTEIDGVHLAEFVAAQTGSKLDMPQVDYTVYQLELTWLDQKTYCFRYYVYVDGAILISSEAPDIINPQLNPNTTWTIDLDNQSIRNAADGAQVPLTILGSSTGQAVSPEGETVSMDFEYKTYLYTDPNTGRIEKFQSVQDSSGALVTVLHDPQIVRPAITNEMLPMDLEMLNQVLTLITLMEQII